MIITTTDDVPNQQILEVVGVAKGCSVRAMHAGHDIVAGMKNALGGEVHEYTAVFAQTREQAIDRMIADAQKLGANAIVGLRFVSTQIGDGVAELLAYGTAVRISD